MNDFERIVDAIDVIEWAKRSLPDLKRVGTVWQSRCIFHTEKTGSLTIYSDGFKCFSCQKSGNIFDLDMQLNNHTKAEALIELARYAGITLEPLSPEHKAKQDRRERLYALMEEACTYYQGQLFLAQGSEALSYLMDKRSLSHGTIVSARLGYSVLSHDDIIRHLTRQGYSYHEMLQSRIISCKDKDETTVWDFFRNRVMIPIRDHKGRIVAFSGRAMDGSNPKYLHNATSDIFEKSKIIHRMPLNRSTMAPEATRDTIIVVEGTIDPITALNRDIYNIASIMGTSISDEQLTLLCAGGITRLVFCLDNDMAGHAALRRLVEKHMHTASDKGVDLYAMNVPHGKDADDTLREMPELWASAVDSARPVTEVLIDRTITALGFDPTPAEMSKTARDLLPILKNSNPFAQKVAIQYLADKVDLAYTDLKSWIEPQIHVLPRHINAPMHMPPNLPTVELKVLHGILVNEDPQRWLDRANIVLGKMPFPKACTPLNADDFTSKPCRDLMRIILEMAARERPFDGLVAAHIGTGPLSEVYGRATCTPDVQAVFASHDARPAFVQSHDDFLQAVYLLRYLKLAVDITHKRTLPEDLVEWSRAKLYLWQMVQKGYVLL